MNDKRILDGWTIFDNPADFPAYYVARRWIANSDGTVTPTADILRHKDLDTVRGMVARVSPQHDQCLTRFENDDPNIVEVWI